MTTFCFRVYIVMEVPWRFLTEKGDGSFGGGGGRGRGGLHLIKLSCCGWEGWDPATYTRVQVLEYGSHSLVSGGKTSSFVALDIWDDIRITATTVARYENSVKNRKYSANWKHKGRMYGRKSRVRHNPILSKISFYFSVFVSHLVCFCRQL